MDRMVRRTKRAQYLSRRQRIEALTTLIEVRRQACLLQAGIKPFCEDYNCLNRLVEALDIVALEWTGDSTRFHAQAHSSGEDT